MNDSEFEILLFTKLREEFGRDEPIRGKFDYILGIINGSQEAFARHGLRLTKFETFLRIENWLRRFELDGTSRQL